MTKFQPGQSGNPSGRPKGAVSPFTKAKTIIAKVFEENEELFLKKMRNKCKEDPIAFYQEFMVAFMPKDINISGGLDLTHGTTKDRATATQDLLAEIESELKPSKSVKSSKNVKSKQKPTDNKKRPKKRPAKS